MASVVDSITMIDDESTSNTLKRRRSSSTIENEIDIEQTPSKRVRSSSITNNSVPDNNHIQSIYSSLNELVQSHRHLVREYVDLQVHHRPDLSLDEQRFIQTEEDLIEKVEKNLHDINHIPSTPPSRNGKRQRYQSINSTNQSCDRIKHETHILKRIEELKSDGKWTNQRLAKCLEPNKRKTHWDYLLDEMRWLAEDFLLEKRWKQAMAKKISLAVLKYFREKNQMENHQQQEEIKRLRKQAQFICKEVMNFWRNMNKIAEFKETTRLEELRKYQLDLNLKTENYSDRLNPSSDDDEETIEQEEQHEPDEYDLNELTELEADREESIDHVLKRHYGIDLSNTLEIDLTQDESSSDNQTSSDEESISDENDLTTTEELIPPDQQINDLSTTAQSFQPTGFTLNTTSIKTPVPFLLKYSLREYQHVGLDWLVTLYENKLNCILADDIGLGKTIQTIALLAHLACEKGNWGPHLIIVPTSLMLHWEIELKKWCPAFKIFTYYSSIKEHPDWTRVNAFHICITSYKLLVQDAKSFRRTKWKYLILDEVQNIKNFKSQPWSTLLNFHSQRRLLLTGTPLQNSYMELWFLIDFLMPNLFSSYEELRECFSNEKLEQEPMETNDLFIERLQKILRPFILRRTKIDVEEQMPKIHEQIIMCDLSKRQREFYENLIQSKSIRDTIEQGNYSSMMNTLIQLKKVCNHPDLYQSKSIVSPFVFEKELIKYEIPKLIFDINFKNPYLAFDCVTHDTFLCFRIKFTLQATKEMIMEIINRPNKNDYSSNRQRIQLTKDIIERYRNTSLWSQTNEITNLRNQSGLEQTDFNDREFQPETIYHDICKQREEDRLSRYELLCRINAERCQFRPLYGCDVLSQIELAMHPCHPFNRTTFSGYALCQTSKNIRDYFTTTDLLRRLVKTNRDVLDECQDILNRFIMCTTRVFASPIDLFHSNGIRLTTPRKPLIEVLSSTDFDVLSSIHHIKQTMSLQFPERKLIEYDCGKLQILAKLLFELKHSKHRCLIFTQMTKMLDILELFLNSHGYTYLRLDGAIEILQRQILIERFNRDDKIFVLILSTRTGGINVNLTGADTVIFYDSEWNSTINTQVQDRCHRIGQIKDVQIYRLISKNTIEENILKKTNQKCLLGDGNSFDGNYFQKNNIRELFKQSTDIVCERRESEEQLDADRLTTTADNETQFQEALASVEDETDRQAAEELNREIHTKFNEEDMEDFNEKQKQQINQVEDELYTLDQQLRPIERYVLRCVESYRTEHKTTQINFDTYLDTEQVRKDWQLSHLKALKEQEEKQLEQDDDELMYTYARDNERKIWITEDGQAFQIWCGIIMKYSTEENEEIYNDDELDFGYESEAMMIEPEEYIRFPLPKALMDTTNTSKSETNILVPRSLFDRSNLLLNTQSSSLSTNTLNKSKQISNNNNNKIFPSTISTPQANIKARQLYVNNGTTTTPLPNSSNTNVIVPASTATSSSSRPLKLEEMLSKDNFQGLLEIDNSDWLISEDYKVLDTIQNIQQLPLSSMSFSSTSNANKPQSMLPNSSLSSSPLLPSTTTVSSSIVNNTTNALTQNWDFISDIVNRYSRVLRTPKQCKHRFEQVIGPREEGRVVYDLIKKKKHVIKGTVKMSDDNWQMLRTNQLFVHDNCQKLVQIYHQKFETIAQFEQQFSSMMYLNKFKQMQIAQAAHHQMRGSKQGSLLQENNINVDVPLTPSDVLYQRSEREKELKQQQSIQSAAANVHPQQQQQTPTTPNNIDTIKQQIPSTNTTSASTITARVRPSSLNTTPTPTPINPSPSTPLSLIPAGSPTTPTIQRSVSSNIIVTNNNHPNMNPVRSQSNILPTRTNLSSSTPTSINPMPSSTNQPSIPTATIVPGQRQVQVLPSNNISTNETNPILQKQVGTVQISSNEYRHVRTVPHQQQTTTPPATSTTTNPLSTPTNLQVRTQNYQRNQAQAAALATLEVRAQLPPSPKSQQQQQQQQLPPRPPSTTPRTSSVTQPQVDYLIQSQTKTLPSSTSQSSLPVAVVRPMQHPSTTIVPTISSSPTSPLNLPTLNVTLPPNKLTTTTTTNPTQQLRTATAYLSNQTTSTSQAQQMPQQIRQLFTNASGASQTTNTQRLTEAAQRSPSSIQQILASRAASLSGQVRNVRILTFTPGTNPPTGIADTTTTTNLQQTPIQSTTNLTYNRSNSSTSSFPRSTINIDQDISPDLAAQLHRIKSFNVTNTDPNDTTQGPRAVLVPARTISGSSTSSTSSAGSSSKLKSSSFIDPSTLGFTAKTSQSNFLLQLPSTATTGGDDQIPNSSGLTRQNLMQHLNLISSNLNQRSQSPTTISNPTAVNRLLQQYQIRAALNASTSTPQSASGQTNTEQISSSSSPTPPPPPPSSSTT